MAGNRDLIYDVKPGDAVSADQMNEMIERAGATHGGGHGYLDGTGVYRYDVEEQAREGVLVVNDDVANYSIPPFGLMTGYVLASASDPTGKDERDIWRVGRYSSTSTTPGGAGAIFINDDKEIPPGKVGLAYNASRYIPRPALYYTDEFNDPYPGCPLGALPGADVDSDGAFKLGPGLPGFMCARNGVDSNGCVLVIRDTMTRAYWAKTYTYAYSGYNGVGVHPVADQQGGLIYDGVSANPYMTENVRFPEGGVGPAAGTYVRAPYVLADQWIMYSVGSARSGQGNGADSNLISGEVYLEGKYSTKFWPTADIANVPAGWTAGVSTLGAYTVITRT
jgi:hypothetical protein